MKKIVCFGEVLWDNFPTGPVPGGAPMNVAYHLSKLGNEASIISAIGGDEKGKALEQFLESKGIATHLLRQSASYPTGEVKVSFKDGEPNYEIVFPAAWDFIGVDSAETKAVKESDALVYGTLAARNDVSRNALEKLLKQASYKVMDVNFRPPFVDKYNALALISKADLVKVNSSELSVIHGWIKGNAAGEDEMAEDLRNEMNIREIILTKGGAGAVYYTGKDKLVASAPAVQIADTVGSGDAFLAGFLSCKLAGCSGKEALSHAVSLAALVTSLPGGCPDYEVKEVEKFIVEPQR